MEPMDITIQKEEKIINDKSEGISYSIEFSRGQGFVNSTPSLSLEQIKGLKDRLNAREDLN